MKTATQLKAKARNLSAKTGIPPHIIQRNYFMERFLERVSLSPYRDSIVLKGGVLITALLGIEARSTIDLDATIRTCTLTPEAIAKIVKEVLQIHVEDGVDFSLEGTEETRVEADYPGCRIVLKIQFDTLRDTIKLDFTAGDAITPKPVEYGYRLMFEDREISVLAYNRETILAEKFSAVLSLDISNTRMKDYYDIYMLLSGQNCTISADTFSEAMGNTAKQRHILHLIPKAIQIVETIEKSDVMLGQWRRFGEAYAYASDIVFSDVVAALKTLSRWSEREKSSLLGIMDEYTAAVQNDKKSASKGRNSPVER